MRRCLPALLMVVAALSASSAAAVTPQNVRGTLVRAPTMPVCIAGRPCQRPAPGMVLVFSASGRDVARVKTGLGGRFALRLAPGRYAIRVGLQRPSVAKLTPRVVRVPEAGVVVLRLVLDTGIR